MKEARVLRIIAGEALDMLAMLPLDLRKRERGPFSAIGRGIGLSTTVRPNADLIAIG